MNIFKELVSLFNPFKKMINIKNPQRFINKNLSVLDIEKTNEIFTVNHPLSIKTTDKTFLALKQIFKVVNVVFINDDCHRYRIGSDKQNAVFGVDYFVIDKNIDAINGMASFNQIYAPQNPYSLFYGLDVRPPYCNKPILPLESNFKNWQGRVMRGAFYSLNGLIHYLKSNDLFLNLFIN